MACQIQFFVPELIFSLIIIYWISFFFRASFPCFHPYRKNHPLNPPRLCPYSRTTIVLISSKKMIKNHISSNTFRAGSLARLNMQIKLWNSISVWWKKLPLDVSTPSRMFFLVYGRKHTKVINYEKPFLHETSLKSFSSAQKQWEWISGDAKPVSGNTKSNF